MKILLVSGPGISLKEPFSSGIESFMVSLANQLIAGGHQVDIVAHDANPGVSFGIVDPFTASPRIKNGLLRRIKEKSEYRSIDFESYDIVHYNMFYPHLYKAGKSVGLPVILTLHSPQSEPRIKAYTRLDRDTDATFVSISERSKELWDDLLPESTTLIHNGIDLQSWPVKKTDDGHYLLWSARITKDKNPLAAIELARHLGLPLKLAGPIADERYFNEAVKPYLSDAIEYVGHATQQELSELAQHASAYLATATWQEPFGLAALEMLASGVRVVGFKAALPYLWNDSCICAVDSTDWRDLITPLVDSDCASTDQCRTFAETMSIQHMAEQYAGLYAAKANESAAENPLLIPSSSAHQLVRTNVTK